MKTKYTFSIVLVLVLAVNLFPQPSVIPTQILPPKIKPEGFAKIISPKDGSSFANTFDMNGIVKKIPSDHHLWLVVSPRESNGCWPQYKEIRPNEKTGEWDGMVTIGGDDGKLLDIFLVSADREANKSFGEYIKNQRKDSFPEQPMPNGAKPLTHITVIKAPDKDDTTNNKVNLNYGFTKSGVFYINKLLIDNSKGEVPCLVAGVTNWRKDIQMHLDGDYYIYEAKIDKPFKIKLEYCFFIGNGNHLPQLLLEQSSLLVNDKDIKLNNTGDGHNFITSPQDYYPGDRN